MAEKTKAQIYMGGTINPIVVDVKRSYYSCYGNPNLVTIIATNGKKYETHTSNVLIITTEEE